MAPSGSNLYGLLIHVRATAHLSSHSVDPSVFVHIHAYYFIQIVACILIRFEHSFIVTVPVNYVLITVYLTIQSHAGIDRPQCVYVLATTSNNWRHHINVNNCSNYQLFNESTTFDHNRPPCFYPLNLFIYIVLFFCLHFYSLSQRFQLIFITVIL